MKTNNTIIGILGGVVTGLALGLLFAPNKGKKTRKKIAEKTMYYSDSVKDTYRNLVGKIARDGEEVIDKEKSKINPISG
jgi:gas vesicle protein